MSAGTSTNVTTGKRTVNGGIYVAPAGTTLPTDATTTLAAAFVNLGYVSEDGVTNTVSKESTAIKEWGGETVAKPQTSQDDTFKWKFIEGLNADVLKLVFGASNVTVTSGAIKVIVNGNNDTPHVIVIDMAQANNRLKRIVIPVATVDSIGDIVYKGTDAVGYDLTIGAAYDATLGGTHAEYISAAPTAGGST